MLFNGRFSPDANIGHGFAIFMLVLVTFVLQRQLTWALRL